MSDVFFEEESREIEKDKEIANTRNQGILVSKAPFKSTPAQNAMMIVFALICFAASYAIWHFKDGFYNPASILFQEEIQEEHLKLIPEVDRSTYINSLPSKNK